MVFYVEFICAVKFLFICSKCFGIIPFSMAAFLNHRRLIISPSGKLFSCISAIFYTCAYFFTTITLFFKYQYSTPSGDIAQIYLIFNIPNFSSLYIEMIVTFLTFIAYFFDPVLMLLNILLYLLKHTEFSYLINEMKIIDDKLLNLNVQVNFRPLRVLLLTLLTTKVIIYILQVSGGIIFFHFNVLNYVLVKTPFVITNLSVIWFISCIMNLRAKINSMTYCLSNITENIELKKVYERDVSMLKTVYLHKEIVPYLSRIRFNEQMKRFSIVNQTSITKQFRVNKLLTSFSKIHGEIHELMKKINSFYGLSLLTLALYVFQSYTVQLYFVFYTFTNQKLPRGFVLPGNYGMEALYLVITGLCFFVSTFVCWKLKQDSKKLTISVFRLANAIDEMDMYKMVINFCSIYLVIEIIFPFFQLKGVSSDFQSQQMDLVACGFVHYNLSMVFNVIIH